MRIAVWHNLPSGGGKRALYYHVRGLVERGHTVESWCPPSADQTYLPLSELIEEHIVPLDWKPSKPGKISSLIARARDPIRLIDALEEHSRQCADAMSSRGFDVLFANTCQIVHSPSIARFVEIPSVLYLQEPNRPLYEALPRLPWIAARYQAPRWNVQIIKSQLRDWLSLSAIRIKAREELENALAYDVILANSAFSAETIMRTYGIRPRVCYLGVDTSLFRDLDRPREPYIISVGSFQAAKGVELALRSLSLLKEPRLRLVWIANFAYEAFVKEMRDLAAELNVPLEIKIRVSDHELVELLNRAMLMLYTPQLEPFGLAPLEANACGTPVVAIAEGGVRETIVSGVNGLLVAPEPQTVADAMAELLGKPELLKRWRQRGIDHVQRQWTLDESVERLENQLIRVALGENEVTEPVAPHPHVMLND